MAANGRKPKGKGKEYDSMSIRLRDKARSSFQSSEWKEDYTCTQHCDKPTKLLENIGLRGVYAFLAFAYTSCFQVGRDRDKHNASGK